MRFWTLVFVVLLTGLCAVACAPPAQSAEVEVTVPNVIVAPQFRAPQQPAEVAVGGVVVAPRRIVTVAPRCVYRVITRPGVVVRTPVVRVPRQVIVVRPRVRVLLE